MLRTDENSHYKGALGISQGYLDYKNPNKNKKI